MRICSRGWTGDLVARLELQSKRVSHTLGFALESIPSQSALSHKAGADFCLMSYLSFRSDLVCRDDLWFHRVSRSPNHNCHRNPLPSAHWGTCSLILFVGFDPLASKRFPVSHLNTSAVHHGSRACVT